MTGKQPTDYVDRQACHPVGHVPSGAPLTTHGLNLIVWQCFDQMVAEILYVIQDESLHALDGGKRECLPYDPTSRAMLQLVDHRA